MIKLLFICSYGQVRSVCGYNLFYTLYPTHYFGICDDPQIDYLDEWCTAADYIFVMSDGHVSYFEKYHPQYLSKIHNLNIEDLWGDCNSPELKEMLFHKVKRILPYDPRLDDFDYESVYVEQKTEYEMEDLCNFWELNK